MINRPMLPLSVMSSASAGDETTLLSLSGPKRICTRAEGEPEEAREESEPRAVHEYWWVAVEVSGAGVPVVEVTWTHGALDLNRAKVANFGQEVSEISDIGERG